VDHDDLLSTSTPIGRKVRPKFIAGGAPLIRVRPLDIAAAGIERVGRVVGVRDGLPLLEGDRVLEVANVIWCTGFHPDFAWIHLPAFDEAGHPKHI
jgi:putative flavoprotein involved in K+ transport